jgi:hypothetical protein
VQGIWSAAFGAAIPPLKRRRCDPQGGLESSYGLNNIQVTDKMSIIAGYRLAFLHWPG